MKHPYYIPPLRVQGTFWNSKIVIFKELQQNNVFSTEWTIALMSSLGVLITCIRPTQDQSSQHSSMLERSTRGPTIDKRPLTGYDCWSRGVFFRQIFSHTLTMLHWMPPSQCIKSKIGWILWFNFLHEERKLERKRNLGGVVDKYARGISMYKIVKD